MDALRCPPRETPISVLSGGERRRVALCRLLLTEPDILLLDEPTNHLDAESVAWLERHLQQYKGTVIAVTHDRYFLDNVAGWILELDRGYGIPWKGNYSSWLEQKQARLALEENGREASASRRWSASWSGSACRRSPAGQGQGARHRLRRPAEPGIRTAPRGAGDLHPARPAPGRRGGRGQRRQQGVSATAAVRGPDLPTAARQHRRRDRPERRRQDHAAAS